MTKTIAGQKAKQGRPGWRVQARLIGTLALAGVVWFALAGYGTSLDAPQTQAAQTQASAGG